MTNLATEVAQLKRRIAQIEKGQRISHGASIENAAVEVRDEDGSLRAIVGQQGDGTTGAVIVNGPPPPQPSNPIVASVLGGVTASWDGLFAAGAVMPLDWARIEVHASTSAAFTPDPVTLQSTIETAQGATVVIACETGVYVRLVARTTSGTASAPSSTVGPYGPTPVVATDILDGIVTTVKLADDAVTAAKLAAAAVDSTALADGAVLSAKLAAAAVSVGKIADNAVTGPAIASDAVTAGKVAADAITARELAAGSVTAAEVAAGAITTDKLTVTGGANILSDPSFEGPYTASLVAGLAYATQDSTKGNGSPTSLKINAVAATATYRSVQLTLMPVLPGEQLALAVDYFVSTDWVGAEVNFQIRWETSSGTVLSYGKASATTPVRNTWTVLGGTFTAPATATVARIRVESGAATAGNVWFDNASVRPVLPGTQIQNGAITTQKIVAGAVQTLQLDAEAVNASKIASGAVTTAKLDALAVTADKIAANTITAGKLAAGSVDATALKADAITGKTITGGTITGSTIQTATSGARIVMDSSVLAVQNSDGDVVAEIDPNDSTGRSAFVTYDTRLGDEYYSAFTAGDLRFGLSGITTVADEGFVSYSSLGENLYELLLSSGHGDGLGAGQINIYSESSITNGSHIDLNAASTAITGTLTAGNHAFGTANITPSAAHTPTSTTVFYNVTGANPRGFVSLNTTVPGVRTPVGAQGVTGVSVSGATTTSMLVWVNRENTVATNVNWQVWTS